MSFSEIDYIDYTCLYDYTCIYIYKETIFYVTMILKYCIYKK